MTPAEPRRSSIGWSSDDPGSTANHHDRPAFFLAGVTAAYLVDLPGWVGASHPKDPAVLSEAPPEPTAGPPDPAVGDSAPAAPVKGSAEAPRVALVIDDVGWRRGAASTYESMDVPLTMAIMPGRPHSRWFYRRWRDRFDLIVHMPMEPERYPEDDPGDMALLLSMSPREVSRRVRTVLDRYPGVVGMNNHMGSAFTRWRPGMDALMEELARRDLFYLDSQTTRDSLAGELGRTRGVPVVRNQVFLDHQRGEAFVRGQLERLVNLARKQGTSVGIGHVQSEVTARVLRRWLPRYRRQGVRFVPLSRIVASRTR